MIRAAVNPPNAPAVRVYDARPLRARLDAILADPNVAFEKIPEVMNEATFHMPLPVARMSGQAPVGDATIDTVFDNATKVDHFLRAKFGRNGWDGQGSTLEVKAYFPSDNANWEYLDDSFWVGDSGLGKSIGLALDVTAHEVAHGMYKSEMYATEDEALNHAPSVWAGAIDESFADVFAAQVDDQNWTMGEGAVDASLVRDLEHPRFANLADVPLDKVVESRADEAAGNVNALPDGEPPIGEHDLSGIPSLAAVRTAKAIGRDNMGQVWYRALTDHLTPDDGFEGAAAATVAAAHELFGAASAQSAAVRDAWISVGVTPTARPD